MEGKRENSAIGTLTYTDITDCTVFYPVKVIHASGSLYAPFSLKLSRMSAELAANIYDLNIQPWIDAGYKDCTFVIEDRVVALDRDSDSRLAAIESEWRRHRARTLIRGVRPIGDLMRAARQLFVTDLGKSIVMTRILPDGRILLIISFIGTTEKFFDWFSNFKLNYENGMHFGFRELARQFDARASRILLPSLAEALNMERYTFADALQGAVEQQDRFLFWISGHSQGGALVQAYTSLLLNRGIDKAQVYAYTFAAPTVACAEGHADPSGYPIYHMINHDDIVPRLGAEIRLGVDLFYYPDDAFRKKYYRLEDLPFCAFERMMMKVNTIESTQDAICFGMALMHMVKTCKDDDIMQAFLSSMIPYFGMIQKVGVSLIEAAKYFEGKLEAQYTVLTGEKPNPTCFAIYLESIHGMLLEFGAETTAEALRVCLRGPHRMRPDLKEETFVPPYIAIVRKYGSELTHKLQ